MLSSDSFIWRSVVNPGHSEEVSDKGRVIHLKNILFLNLFF